MRSFRHKKVAACFGWSAKRRLLVAIALGGLAVAFVPPLAAGFGNDAWQEANEHCRGNQLPRRIKHKWKCREVPISYHGTITLHEHMDYTCPAVGRAHDDLYATAILFFKLGSQLNEEHAEKVEYHLEGGRIRTTLQGLHGGYFGCAGSQACTVVGSGTVKVDHEATKITYNPATGAYEIGATAAEEAVATEYCPESAEPISYEVPHQIGAGGIATESAPPAIHGLELEVPPNQSHNENFWVKKVWKFQAGR